MTKEEKEDLVKEKRQALAEAHQKADEAFEELIKIRADIDQRTEAFRQLEEAKANAVIAKAAALAQTAHQESGIAELRLEFEATERKANEAMNQSRSDADSRLEAAKALHQEAWDAAGAVYNEIAESAGKKMAENRIRFDAAVRASRDIANHTIAQSQKSVESFRDEIVREEEAILKNAHAWHEAVHQAEIDLLQAEQSE